MDRRIRVSGCSMDAMPSLCIQSTQCNIKKKWLVRFGAQNPQRHYAKFSLDAARLLALF
jgi:hypothetical protein